MRFGHSLAPVLAELAAGHGACAHACRHTPVSKPSASSCSVRTRMTASGKRASLQPLPSFATTDSCCPLLLARPSGRLRLFSVPQGHSRGRQTPPAWAQQQTRFASCCLGAAPGWAHRIPWRFPSIEASRREQEAARLLRAHTVASRYFTCAMGWTLREPYSYFFFPLLY